MKNLLIILLVFTASVCLGQSEPDSSKQHDTQFYMLIGPTIKAQKTSSFQDSILPVSHEIAAPLTTLLAQNPGLALKSNGATGLATMAVDGLPGNQTAVLWNDLNLQNVMNGYMDFSLLPAFMHGNAVLNRGVTSAPGGGGLGGSISLGPSFATEGLAQMGSFGERALGIGVGINNAYFPQSWRFYRQRANNNFNFNHPDFQPFKQDNSAINQLHLKHDSRIKIYNQHLLHLHFWYAATEREIPRTLFESKAASVQQDSSIRGQIGHEMGLAGGKLFTSIGGLFDQINFNDSIKGFAYRNSSMLVKAETKWLKDFHLDSGRIIRFKTGISYSYMEANTDNYKRLHRTRLYAGFADIERRSSQSPFTYKLGLRVENCRGQTPVTGQFDANYSLHKNLKAFINAGHSYRFATFNDLYWQPGGNEYLKPESAWKSSLGLRFYSLFSKSLIHSLTLKNALTTTKNLILWLPDDNMIFSAINILNTNGISSQVDGRLKLTAKRAKTTLRYYASRTISVMNSGINKGSQLPYVPIWQGGLQLSLEHSWFNSSLNFNYLGRRFINDDNSSSLEPIPLVNVQISKPFSFKWVKLTPNLLCNNLLNQYFFSTVAMPMPGRNFQFSLHIQPIKK
ncbi:MAG: TonB-dependent receptor [Bacteroidetes bacterium]|nr:TonB-dependent receptor [Bacteroidota bacterium]